MTGFLAGFDQFSFKMLMLLYSFLGVQDIPKRISADWTVIERWVVQPDSTLRLTIESTTAPEECRQARARYIVFPQTYEGKQEVYADSTRIYTNELDEVWHLRSVLDRIVINCDLFQNAKTLRFQSSTQIKYYASINTYPYTLQKYPSDQFLYDLSYMLSATISLFVALVGTMILYLMDVKHFRLVGLGLAIATLMLTHVAGYFVSIYIGTAHVIQMIGSFFIAYFYMLGKIPLFSNTKFRIAFFALVIFSIFASVGHRNSNQFLLLAVAGATVTIGLIYALTAKNLNKGIRINLLIGLPIVLFDIYRAQAYREGYANLAGLVIAVMTFEIIHIVRNVYKVNLKTKKIEGSLDSERKLLQKISSSNEHLKSVIHDLKAPITSLNFSLQPAVVDREQIILISKRFNSIFANLSGDKANPMAGWFPVQSMVVNLDEVCVEMGSMFQEISLTKCADYAGFVFYFVEDFKNAISEILMNSFKAAAQKGLPARASILFENSGKGVQIVITDKSGGISENIFNNLTVPGITKGGTGMGLWTIKKRIAEVEGKISFQNRGNGFEVCLKYMRKS